MMALKSSFFARAALISLTIGELGGALLGLCQQPLRLVE